MKKTNQQPVIPRGYEFTGWATFNWGICHQKVYRTRKEAIAACVDTGNNGSTWDSVKSHFRVVKVRCIVE
ncbi:MAG TPA: hypothetical protein VI911_00075 [Patescibacteria group bacterium]|nr:hypothetical protein [Patescibacteria group bacterium]